MIGEDGAVLLENHCSRGVMTGYYNIGSNSHHRLGYSLYNSGYVAYPISSLAAAQLLASCGPDFRYQIVARHARPQPEDVATE
jgi:hypothetical protein